LLGALNLIGTANVIEELSFDCESRDDTCRVNCNPSEVPEPASFGFFGSGILAIGLLRRFRRRLPPSRG
jgi:hypothetical protein